MEPTKPCCHGRKSECIHCQLHKEDPCLKKPELSPVYECVFRRDHNCGCVFQLAPVFHA